MQKKSITQAEMIERISSLTDLTKKDVKAVLTEFQTIIASELIDKGIVKLGILGTAKIKISKARIVGLKTENNQKVIIPSKAQPKFTFSKAFKEVIADSINVEEIKDLN